MLIQGPVNTTLLLTLNPLLFYPFRVCRSPCLLPMSFPSNLASRGIIGSLHQLGLDQWQLIEMTMLEKSEPTNIWKQVWLVC